MRFLFRNIYNANSNNSGGEVSNQKNVNKRVKIFLYILCLIFVIQIIHTEKILKINEKDLNHNFASFKGGAYIISSCAKCLKSTELLNDNQDKYLMIPKNVESKWVVIGLSEEIKIKSIQIANFEYFSCSIKNFSVYGLTTYPKFCTKENDCKYQNIDKEIYLNKDEINENQFDNWVFLGNFSADTDSKKLQTFQIEKKNQKMARYVKIEINTVSQEDHYYVTLSSVKIFGSTLLQDVREHIKTEEEKNILRKNIKDEINKEDFDEFYHFIFNKEMDFFDDNYTFSFLLDDEKRHPSQFCSNLFFYKNFFFQHNFNNSLNHPNLNEHQNFQDQKDFKKDNNKNIDDLTEININKDENDDDAFINLLVEDKDNILKQLIVKVQELDKNQKNFIERIKKFYKKNIKNEMNKNTIELNKITLKKIEDIFFQYFETSKYQNQEFLKIIKQFLRSLKFESLMIFSNSNDKMLTKLSELQDKNEIYFNEIENLKMLIIFLFLLSFFFMCLILLFIIICRPKNIVTCTTHNTNTKINQKNEESMNYQIHMKRRKEKNQYQSKSIVTPIAERNLNKYKSPKNFKNNNNNKGEVSLNDSFVTSSSPFVPISINDKDLDDENEISLEENESDDSDDQKLLIKTNTAYNLKDKNISPHKRSLSLDFDKIDI